jgi:hypothetical protein
MSASNYLENELLDHAFGGGDYARPASVYVSLHSADPGDTGASELSGGGYARAAVTNNSTNFPAASGGEKANANPIEFPEATADWPQATHFGVWDASTGGNFLVGGPLDEAKTVQEGDTASFAADALVLGME